MILCPLLSLIDHGFDLLVAVVLVPAFLLNHAVDLRCGGQVVLGNVHQCMKREGGQTEATHGRGGCVLEEAVQLVCTFFGHVRQLGGNVSGTVEPACYHRTLGVHSGGVQDRCVTQFRRWREHSFDDLIGFVQSCFDALGFEADELAEEILYRIGKALERSDLLALGVDGVQLGTERLV